MEQLLTASALPAAGPATRRSWLKRLGAALGAGLLARAATASPAHIEASDDQQPFVGEIIMFAFNFPPKNYALCNGQLLPIAQNTALFSIIGTQYGGDGRSTFALPNLQGVTPSHANGSGGATSNGETVTLNTTQLPSHSHTVPVSNAAADSPNPASQVRAVANGLNVNGEAVAVQPYASTPTTQTQAAAAAIGPSGSGQAVTLQAPYLVMNYCIALFGVFPQRP